MVIKERTLDAKRAYFAGFSAACELLAKYIESVDDSNLSETARVRLAAGIREKKQTFFVLQDFKW